MYEVNGEMMVKLTEAVTIPRADYEALLLDRAMLGRLKKLMQKEINKGSRYGTSLTIYPIDVGLDDIVTEEAK